MSELRAWIEIATERWRKNYHLITADKPVGVKIAAVLKDDAYGHGAVRAAKIAVDAGVAFLAVVTVDEALELRKAGITAPILMLGQRLPGELDECLENNLTCCLHDLEVTKILAAKAERRGIRSLRNVGRIG
jgi:alanine racemase